jgi:hypothetical protein
VERFAAADYDVDQTVQWMSLGYTFFEAELWGARWGATPQEAAWLLPYVSDLDSEIADSEVWFDHMEAGVPAGLMCLFYWSGCKTVSDLGSYVERWRAGEDIEPGLRLLAGLVTADVPVPPVDAQPQFPPPR